MRECVIRRKWRKVFLFYSFFRLEVCWSHRIIYEFLDPRLNLDNLFGYRRVLLRSCGELIESTWRFWWVQECWNFSFIFLWVWRVWCCFLFTYGRWCFWIMLVLFLLVWVWSWGCRFHVCYFFMRIFWRFREVCIFLLVFIVTIWKGFKFCLWFCLRDGVWKIVWHRERLFVIDRIWLFFRVSLIFSFVLVFSFWDGRLLHWVVVFYDWVLIIFYSFHHFLIVYLIFRTIWFVHWVTQWFFIFLWVDFWKNRFDLH